MSKIDYSLLQKYLNDDNIIEIMCNENGSIWLDTYNNGMISTEDIITPKNREIFLRTVASANSKSITESTPSLSAKLPEYSARLQGEVFPIVNAPVFTIRKPTKNVIPLEKYVSQEIITEKMMLFIKNEFLNHKTFIISGGTGSGKTSLCNAMLQVLSDTAERIYIIEDTPELVCNAKNHVAIMINLNFTYTHAVKASLRHRPDRIIVGEVRDASALDLLKSWNTGHKGGLTTIHANSALSVSDRLIQLVGESGQVCSLELINEAIDYIVHIAKNNSGRKITSILEVVSVRDSNLRMKKIL